MFEKEELKRYSNNILFEFRKSLEKDLKKQKKADNNTLIQFTTIDINLINEILELRGEL